METLLAKALYDNTAETGDELAFRRGDIITVLEQWVAGSSDWWKCSLHGRQGLAPANRLSLISPAEENDQKHQNIYQIPKPNRPSPDIPIYEEMKTIYNVPGQAPSSTEKNEMARDDPDGANHQHDVASRNHSDIYDVPSLPFRPTTLERQKSMMPSDEIRKHYQIQWRSAAAKTNVVSFQDPNYDIPMPSKSENVLKLRSSTLPNPCTPDWIYDSPVCLQKHARESNHYDTLPTKSSNTNTRLYNTLHVLPKSKLHATELIYDMPKPVKSVQFSTDESIYDVPPALKKENMDSSDRNESLKTKLQTPVSQQHHHYSLRGRAPSKHLTEGTKDNQRCSTVSTSSTASSSSRSSCDSFMLSSPEPEVFREITLSQEEAGNHLLELQNRVSQCVPKLMLFVSSQWRCREHLDQHLDQIRVAAEDVTDSISGFLNFASDVRGNAQRLTDFNLQNRLLKQLSILEDSGLILQQAAAALRDLDWMLDALAQDPDQSQTPDHLERFVMVARTVPEDVKRLVSILNANGKLLFKASAKVSDSVEESAEPRDKKRSDSRRERTVDSGIDESDYVMLQQTNTEQQVKTEKKSSLKLKRNSDLLKKQVIKSQPVTPRGPVQTCSISDHCRLYFGAIQKAIAVFLSSLSDGQPPEKFISHSKLVIMVGQRLVNTLYSEAQGQEGLSMSNQLCAHLKQLAVATKKAALDFPDQPALQEAQAIAKDLAERAQHFRTSLDP